MTDDELLTLDEPSFVEHAYLNALGRAPDPQGMRDYLHRLGGGVSKLQVLAELRGSAEARAFAARQGAAKATPRPRQIPAQPNRGRSGVRRGIGLQQLLTCDSAEFIELAYRATLLRVADESGRRNCAWLLASGISRVEVLRQLLESEEGRARNVPLPEVREAIARQRYARMPGVRHALRAWRIVWSRFSTSRNKRPGHSVSASTLPTLDPVRWQSKDHNDVYRGTMNQDSTDTLSAAAAGDKEHQDSPASSYPSDLGRVAGSNGGGLTLDRFVGPIAYGTSYLPNGASSSVSVEFGARAIGKIVPSLARSEMQDALGLSEPSAGFSVVLGGLLQFAAMAPDCATFKLTQTAANGASCLVDLAKHFEQALTFSPMRALMRWLPGDLQVGTLRSMRLVSPADASLIFESTASTAGGAGRIFIDFYQEQGSGSLTRLRRFLVELAGEVTALDFRMLDARKPILMVVTDESRGIIATDCIPLPTLHSAANLPLLEYHVVLESGKSAFSVAAKLARSYFDAILKPKLTKNSAPSRGPRAATTCVVLYSRGVFDTDIAEAISAHAGFAPAVVYLNHDGLLVTADGGQTHMADFLSATPAQHVLLLDVEARLRPDFWAIIDDNRFRFTDDSGDLVYWHSIWVDGLSRPYVVKNGLLLDPAFEGHALLPTRSALVRKAALAQAFARGSDRLRSGRLVIEAALSFVEASKLTLVPLVMDTVRIPMVPAVQQRYLSEHAELPSSPGDGGAPEFTGGVSVIINYRDSVEASLRCLDSIRLQDFRGDLEIVLVNNGSTADSVAAIVGRAVELFGAEGVRAIDYPLRFNHSAQCNIAAVAAKHDTLFMLSNDSLLRTRRAIARAAAIANVSWVGSVGFRIVGSEAAKSRLQSVGLALNERRYLFAGGSPVSTFIGPPFAMDKSFEVIGNTFAAVMLRRSVYAQLNGLDAEAFPTNYNDVDFSFRATHAGYRHVVIGAEIVEHMGRGSREADLDLPIDQRIIERAPRLDLLARIGFQQL